MISIHALLAESDADVLQSALENHGFLSTLSLRRATGSPAKVSRWIAAFLSTLSLRRATLISGEAARAEIISIHALLAESDTGANETTDILLISIHALLAESDCLFSTLYRIIYISIHALLAESDAGKQ